MNYVYGIEISRRKDDWKSTGVTGIIYGSKERAWNSVLSEAYETYAVGGLVVDEHPEWLLVDIYEPNGLRYATIKVVELIFVR